MKRTAAAFLAAVLALCLCAAAGAEKVITLTFAGDCTLGCGEDDKYYIKENFDAVIAQEGYDYCFANFRDLFSGDDCTIVNFEGVLQNTKDGEKKSKSFRFRGLEDYVNILREGSVEAVSLSNNHTFDYSTQGFNNTRRVLDEAGIHWAYEDQIWIFEKDGIRIGFGSVYYTAFGQVADKMRDRLLQLRKNGEIDAAVLLVHAGTEYAGKHTDQQDQFAEFFIKKAGADLVIMHHPHVLQGIRILNDRSIFYSLGNFVFGGYYKVTLGNNTNSLYTMAVQVKMYFSDDGKYKGQQAYLYPAYDSGSDQMMGAYLLNNYQPVRVNAEEAIPVVEAIQRDTAWQLPEIREDETGKAYLVLDYLPAEEESTGADPESGEPEPPAAKPDK